MIPSKNIYCNNKGMYYWDTHTKQNGFKNKVYVYVFNMNTEMKINMTIKNILPEYL